MRLNRYSRKTTVYVVRGARHVRFDIEIADTGSIVWTLMPTIWGSCVRYGRGNCGIDKYNWVAFLPRINYALSAPQLTVKVSDFRDE